MIPLGELLKNQTRTEVLRKLALLGYPQGVRALAVFAGTHPYATSKALHELLEEGLIEKEGSKSRPTYRFRSAHPESARLQLLFEADRNELLRREREDLSRRAREFLKFNRQALRAIQQAKESIHGPV
ncbi:MAG: hypothetical protein JJU29_18835 [Verrucomicrobia bacterium]|nr:hypothetical protein [Verrucomicrobiota bacterium]MCH8513645.1 hypothetical protein [Kiritimatiellia bacterium]